MDQWLAGGWRIDPQEYGVELMKFWNSADFRECMTSKAHVQVTEGSSEQEDYNLVEDMGLGPRKWMRSG